MRSNSNWNQSYGYPQLQDLQTCSKRSDCEREPFLFTSNKINKDSSEWKVFAKREHEISEKEIQFWQYHGNEKIFNIEVNRRSTRLKISSVVTFSKTLNNIVFYRQFQNSSHHIHRASNSTLVHRRLLSEHISLDAALASVRWLVNFDWYRYEKDPLSSFVDMCLWRVYDVFVT